MLLVKSIIFYGSIPWLSFPMLSLANSSGSAGLLRGQLVGWAATAHPGRRTILQNLDLGMSGVYGKKNVLRSDSDSYLYKRVVQRLLKAPKILMPSFSTRTPTRGINQLEVLDLQGVRKNR